MNISRYLLTAEQATKFRDVAEVRISTWGVVTPALDHLIATGLYGNTRAEVYYRLAMEKLMELEKAGDWTWHP